MMSYWVLKTPDGPGKKKDNKLLAIFATEREGTWPGKKRKKIDKSQFAFRVRYMSGNLPARRSSMKRNSNIDKHPQGKGQKVQTKKK